MPDDAPGHQVCLRAISMLPGPDTPRDKNLHIRHCQFIEMKWVRSFDGGLADLLNFSDEGRRG
jgi:hypothetical protein